LQEYEVDFRSYFRVAWQKRWIIISIFVLAVGIAAIISFTPPNQYEARTLLLLQASPPFEKILPPIPSLPQISEIFQSDQVLASVAEKLKNDPSNTKKEIPSELAGWLKQRLRANVLEKAGLLELEISGSRSTQELRQVLAELTTLVKSRLGKEFKADVESQLGHLEESFSILDEQLKQLKTKVQTEIVERKRILETQRDELKKRLEITTTNPQLLKLPAGEQTSTLQGAVLRKEFGSLNDRLNTVEQELQMLDSQGRSLFPELSQQINALENDRMRQFNILSQNRQVLAAGWEVFKILSAPYASEQPIGPKRLPNLLLAGVLGLLLGIALAFVKHYLEQPLASAKKQA